LFVCLFACLFVCFGDSKVISDLCLFVCLFVFFSTQQISKASNEAKKEETIERFDSIV